MNLDRLVVIPLVFFSLIVGGVIAALVTEVSTQELVSAVTHPETLFALKFSLAISAGAILVAHEPWCAGCLFPGPTEFQGPGAGGHLDRYPLGHASVGGRSGDCCSFWDAECSAAPWPGWAFISF